LRNRNKAELPCLLFNHQGHEISLNDIQPGGGSAKSTKLKYRPSELCSKCVPTLSTF
jgi:hypothetical protein